MKFQLGAMSVGDILDRGLKLLLSRLVTFYAINLIALLPYLAFVGAVPFVVAGNMAVAAALGIVGLVLVIIFSQVAAAAVLRVIAEEYIGRRVGIGEALSFAFGKFAPLLGTSILAGLVIGVGLLMCVVPGI